MGDGHRSGGGGSQSSSLRPKVGLRWFLRAQLYLHSALAQRHNHAGHFLTSWVLCCMMQPFLNSSSPKAFSWFEGFSIRRSPSPATEPPAWLKPWVGWRWAASLPPTHPRGGLRLQGHCLGLPQGWLCIPRETQEPGWWAEHREGLQLNPCLTATLLGRLCPAPIFTASPPSQDCCEIKQGKLHTQPWRS